MKILITESHYLKLFEAANISDIYEKYYSSIPQDEFNEIISSDPTWRREKPNKMGKYGKWLLSLYMRDRLKLEDLYKAKEYLSYFIKYFNVINEKDINKYQSLSSLYNAVKEYMDEPNKATSKQDEVRKIKEGAEKVYEDGEWLIIVPKTKEASCYYGKGTQWCTASDTSKNYFDDYNDEGNLYININKTNGEKYQFHFESDSFMDSSDDSIKPIIFKTIGLSEGALNWYKNNVKEWYKIAEEKYNLSSSTFEVTIKRIYGNEYWSFYDAYDDRVVAINLIFDSKNISKLYDSINKFNYAAFDNSSDMKTVIMFNHSNGLSSLYSSRLKNVLLFTKSEIYDTSILETIDGTDGAFELVTAPDGISIYKNNNPNEIKHVSEIYEFLYSVEKTNGFVDLVNFDGYVLPNVKLLDDMQIESDDNEGDFVYVINQQGKKIKVWVETLEIAE